MSAIILSSSSVGTCKLLRVQVQSCLVLALGTKLNQVKPLPWHVSHCGCIVVYIQCYKKRGEGLAPSRDQAAPKESDLVVLFIRGVCVASGYWQVAVNDCQGCRVGVAIAGCLQADQRQLQVLQEELIKWISSKYVAAATSVFRDENKNGNFRFSRIY